MSRKLKIIFTLSLLLNVLLLGVVAGYGSKRHWAGMHPRPQLEEALTRLPEAQRAAFEARMEALRRESGERRERMKALRHELSAVMRKEPFDAEEYERISAQMRAQMDAMMASHAQLVRDMARELPPDARTGLIRKERGR